ncbi:hypothetical protein MANES_13G089700v8 [Manihot esculenta]|uniref:Uncharacterized protein n=1 Tax=Manihot esculenta TaxID=3983 RepID=A0ACB7GLX4_MANES|nr:hypothetical protein MANES_13G089700v8 [Manihot esculenta]
MDMYDHIHQIGMWGESFKSNGISNASASIFVAGNLDSSPSILMAADTELDNQSEDTSHGTLGPSSKYDLEASKLTDKIQRRLAQNREAARKSRLRKKAYVQQLESSCLKLIQLEQELEMARNQGLYIGGVETSQMGFAGPINSESGINHYSELFRMKAIAAKADVFYLMSGMWKSSAERFFLWIGGFRPSELLKVLKPQLEPLTDQQLLDVCNLKQSCQQAEDALSQGMEKLQQTLAETVAAGRLGEASHMPQMNTAMEKLEGLVRFVQQADHLRQITLQQMSLILTARQAARGLLALGEYFERLRALSTIWVTNPRELA